VSTTPARVSVRIMEQDFVVACGPEERTALLAAAELVNMRMWEVHRAGRVAGMDRIAVTVALNLANELLQQKSHDAKLQSAASLIRTLRIRVEAALGTGLTIVNDSPIDGTLAIEELPQPAPASGSTMPLEAYTPSEAASETESEAPT